MNEITNNDTVLARLYIKIEADTIEEAKKIASSKVPEGARIISKKIISRSSKGILKGMADTVEKASKKAENKVKKNMRVIDKRVDSKPEVKFINIEAFDEDSAELKIKESIDNSVRMEELVLKEVGKKGILGIGKRPNIYRAKLFHKAIVNIEYKTTSVYQINFEVTCLKCQFCEKPARKPSQYVSGPICGTCNSIASKLKRLKILNKSDINKMGIDFSYSTLAYRSCISEVAYRSSQPHWHLYSNKERLTVIKTIAKLEEIETYVRVGDNEYLSSYEYDYLD